MRAVAALACVLGALMGACGSRPARSNDRLGVPATPAAPRPLHPDAALVTATPVDCTDLGMSGPPTKACEPRVLSSTPNGLATRVWESPCHVFDLRNDGAVDAAHEGAHHRLVGEPPTPRASSKLAVDSVVAGSSAVELLMRPTGGPLLVTQNGAQCEALPMPPARTLLAGRSDGHVFYWGRDAGGALHLVERTSDASWRVWPALRADDRLGVDLWDHGGRVVASYHSSGTDGNEIGYYDAPSHQLRPIRRGIPMSNLQLVPGVAPDEPPTAFYADGHKLFVDQPDLAHGYRRIERSIESIECPAPEVVNTKSPPRGNFTQRANPILFRTTAGALWLAYTEARGRCTYQLATSPPANPLDRRDDGRRHQGRRDPFLIARPAPEPPRWQVDHLVETASLVLTPIERGHFGKERRVELPRRELRYAGPWQFHPSVTDAMVRIAIGSVIVDLDPGKLTAGPSLATPWVAPRREGAPVVTVVRTPPPANAPPFPALRMGPLASSIGVMTQPSRTVETPRFPKPSTVMDTCQITPRTPTDSSKVLAHQVVIRCDAANAIGLAADGARAVFTQYSQQGYKPLVEIDARGDVEIRPPGREGEVRIVRGAIQFGHDLPAKAPSIPPGWTIHDSDGSSVFASRWDRDNELLRGTVDRSNAAAPVWDWQPAFGNGRTPPKGQRMSWPVFLHRKGADPAIVYANDPRVTGDIYVRTRAGSYVPLPTWGTGRQSDYRVDELTAVEIKGQELPVIAAKFDSSIVVASPASNKSYSLRALPGNESFEELRPPKGPVPPGATCAVAVVDREREELYSPQLFVWGTGAGLAYLSSRVRERLRWSVVPPGCGWIVDDRTITNELAIARIDATGATEVHRVPVELKPNGFRGANLLVDVQGSILHTIATSYGVATYSRLALRP